MNTSLVLTATPKGGPRLHRATCKRISAAAISTTNATPKALRDAMLATCCKPTEAQREQALTPATPEPTADPCMADDEVANEMAWHGSAQPLTVVPAIGATSEGRGELAGGDVQALPLDRKPRTRKSNRHDQRTPLPTGDLSEQQANLLALRKAAAEGAQQCTGACGQTLPLVKFPTTAKGGRGTECRHCRDTRRAAKPV